MSEGQFEGSSPEGVSQELVPETDAKDRRRTQQISQHRDLRAESGWVAGAVRKEDAIGMKFANFVDASGRRDDGESESLGELIHHGRLDAVVEGHHVQVAFAALVGLGSRDVVHEIATVRSRC